MNAKRMLKADPKLPTEIQEHITHAPIEEVQVKKNGNGDSKRDEADIRTFLSTDTYDSWDSEYDDVDRDYLK